MKKLTRLDKELNIYYESEAPFFNKIYLKLEENYFFIGYLTIENERKEFQYIQTDYFLPEIIDLAIKKLKNINL